MLGDTAVAINPKDSRAAALRGAQVRLPIVERLIPIIEDDYVVLPDPESSDEKARYSSSATRKAAEWIDLESGDASHSSKARK